MTEPDSITITANGKTFDCHKDTAIETFLSRLNLCIDHVIVEYNKRALTKRETAAVVLKDGDQLEIVRIIAGG